MFFRKKKKELDLDALTTEVMFRMRGLLLDAQLEEAFSLSVISGTSMVSDEVAQKEQEESDLRFSRIAHLQPLIFAHTYHIAKSMAELQRIRMGKGAEVIDPEEWENVIAATQQIALASVVGSLSQMVDLNLLTVGPRIPRSNNDKR
jgi:hypothetical protein